MKKKQSEMKLTISQDSQTIRSHQQQQKQETTQPHGACQLGTHTLKRPKNMEEKEGKIVDILAWPDAIFLLKP